MTSPPEADPAPRAFALRYEDDWDVAGADSDDETTSAQLSGCLAYKARSNTGTVVSLVLPSGSRRAEEWTFVVRVQCIEDASGLYIDGKRLERGQGMTVARLAQWLTLHGVPHNIPVTVAAPLDLKEWEALEVLPNIAHVRAVTKIVDGTAAPRRVLDKYSGTYGSVSKRAPGAFTTTSASMAEDSHPETAVDVNDFQHITVVHHDGVEVTWPRAVCRVVVDTVMHDALRAITVLDLYDGDAFKQELRAKLRSSGKRVTMAKLRKFLWELLDDETDPNSRSWHDRQRMLDTVSRLQSKRGLNALPGGWVAGGWAAGGNGGTPSLDIPAVWTRAQQKRWKAAQGTYQAPKKVAVKKIDDALEHERVHSRLPQAPILLDLGEEHGDAFLPYAYRHQLLSAIGYNPPLLAHSACWHSLQRAARRQDAMALLQWEEGAWVKCVWALRASPTLSRIPRGLEKRIASYLLPMCTLDVLNARASQVASEIAYECDDRDVLSLQVYQQAVEMASTHHDRYLAKACIDILNAHYKDAAHKVRRAMRAHCHHPADASETSPPYSVCSAHIDPNPSGLPRSVEARWAAIQAKKKKKAERKPGAAGDNMASPQPLRRCDYTNALFEELHDQPWGGRVCCADHDMYCTCDPTTAVPPASMQPSPLWNDPTMGGAGLTVTLPSFANTAISATEGGEAQSPAEPSAAGGEGEGAGSLAAIPPLPAVLLNGDYEKTLEELLALVNEPPTTGTVFELDAMGGSGSLPTFFQSVMEPLANALSQAASNNLYNSAAAGANGNVGATLAALLNSAAPAGVTVTPVTGPGPAAVSADSDDEWQTYPNGSTPADGPAPSTLHPDEGAAPSASAIPAPADVPLPPQPVPVVADNGLQPDPNGSPSAGPVIYDPAEASPVPTLFPPSPPQPMPAAPAAPVTGTSVTGTSVTGTSGFGGHAVVVSGNPSNFAAAETSTAPPVPCSVVDGTALSDADTPLAVSSLPSTGSAGNSVAAAPSGTFLSPSASGSPPPPPGLHPTAALEGSCSPAFLAVHSPASAGDGAEEAEEEEVEEEEEGVEEETVTQPQPVVPPVSASSPSPGAATPVPVESDAAADAPHTLPFSLNYNLKECTCDVKEPVKPYPLRFIRALRASKEMIELGQVKGEAAEEAPPSPIASAACATKRCSKRAYELAEGEDLLLDDTFPKQETGVEVEASDLASNCAVCLYHLALCCEKDGAIALLEKADELYQNAEKKDVHDEVCGSQACLPGCDDATAPHIHDTPTELNGSKFVNSMANLLLGGYSFIDGDLQRSHDAYSKTLQASGSALARSFLAKIEGSLTFAAQRKQAGRAVVHKKVALDSLAKEMARMDQGSLGREGRARRKRMGSASKTNLSLFYSDYARIAESAALLSHSLDDVEKGLAKAPKKPFLHQLRAALQADLGHTEDAIQSISKSIGYNIQASDLYLRAVLQVKLGRTKAAVADLCSCLLFQPTHAPALELLDEHRKDMEMDANVLEDAFNARSGFVDKASCLYQWINIKPNNPYIYCRVSKFFFRLGGKRNVHNYWCHKALQVCDPLWAPLFKGLLAESNRDNERAAVLFKEAVRNLPTEYECHLMVAYTLVSLGRYEDSTQVLQCALHLATHPSHCSVIYNNIGYNYRCCKMYQKALVYFEKSKAFISHLHHTFFNPFSNASEIYHMMGERQRAVDEIHKGLKMAIEITPCMLEELLARASFSSIEEVLSLCAKIITLDPYNEFAYPYITHVLWDSNHFEGGLEKLNEGIELTLGTQALVMRGEAFYLERPAEAVRDLAMVLLLDPHNEAALRLYAASRRKAGPSLWSVP